MGFRRGDHPRSEMFNANCGKCGDRIMIPWDPKKEPGKVVMCRNCRTLYCP